jgi:CfrBI restriction endonuclease
LAVKRAALRSGAWSTAGKQVEKNLMAALCGLLKVPKMHYDQTNVPESMREVDFYLIKDDKYNRCEVKLMGKGNPESADAIFARESNVFVADKLSDLNKKQADGLNVKWVELRAENGYKKMETILAELDIPYTTFVGNLNEAIDEVLLELFA